MSKKEKNSKQNPSKSNDESSFKKWTKRLLIFLLLFVVFIIGGVVVSLQFKSVRTSILNFAEGEINKSLNAKVNVDDFRLYSLKAIELYDISMTLESDTIAAIPEATAFFNIGDLIDGKIFLTSLSLDKAVINMLRDSAGVWNVSKIPRKFPNDTTPPADTKILFSNLEMNDGEFRMYDPYAPKSKSKGFNTSNLHLKDLNFSGELFIRPAKKKLIADLINLSFYEEIMDKRLSPTNLTFMIDSNFVKVEDLEYQSDVTELDLKAEIYGIDIFGGIKDGDFESAEIEVKANATQLDVSEVFTLLNIPANFKGKYDLELDASGSMNNILIDNFDLKLDNSNLQLSGNIKDVTKSDELYFNLKTNDTYLTYNDVKEFLNLRSDNFPNFKYADFYFLKMTGHPKDLHFDINANTGVGSLIGDLTVHTQGNLELEYEGKINNFDIKELYPESISTNLNGKVNTNIKNVNSNNLFISLDYEGGKNRIDDYSMTALKIKFNSERFETFSLDTIYAEFGSNTFSYLPNEVIKKYVSGSGQLHLKKDRKKSNYSLDLKYNALNLNDMLGSEEMPTYISGFSKLNGSGIEINNIVGNFETEIETIMFDDRSFFPFNFDLLVEKQTNDNRRIYFDSDFGTITLEGNYNFENTIDALQKQGYYMFNFIANEVNKLIPEDQDVVKEIKLLEVDKIGEYNPIDATLKVKVSDFSFITAFLDDINLRMNTELNFHLFADKEESSLYINKLLVEDFYYNKGEQTISTNKVEAEGGLYMKIQDSMSVFSDFDLKANAENRISINSNSFNYPQISLEFDGEQFDFTGASDINNQIDIAFDGSTNIIPGGIKLGFSRLDLSYKDEYTLQLSEDIDAKFVDGGFTINSMDLENPNSDEKLLISGEYNSNNEKFSDFSFVISSLDIKGIKPFLPRKNQEQFEQIDGKIDSLQILINGSVSSPELDFFVSSNDIKVNEQMVGDIKTELKYRNKDLKGKLVIDHYNDEKDFPELIKGQINSLPLDLSFVGVEDRFNTGKNTDIEFDIDSLPLSIVSPFIPSISYLKGTGKGKLMIDGTLPDGLNLNGIIRFNNSSFLVDATNVSYKAKGGLILKENTVFLEDVILYNQQDDLSNGRAEVSGKIELENLDINKLDLGLKTNRFLVMRDETQKVKKDLYGRLIISTEEDSLRFWGTLQKPNLEGYVALESANLKLPDEEEIQLVKSKFIYRRKGDLITASYGRADSVKVKKVAKAQEVQESLMELLNIDLDLEFRGRTLVDMQINQFLRTSVILGTPINVKSIRYVKKRDNKEAKLYGRIILKEGSKLSFFKTFEISGDINFPTGNISNPQLDLKAEYQGTTKDYKQFNVEIYVTGTKDNPILRFEYDVAGESGYGDKEEKLSNIITLLLTGSSSDSNRNGNGNQVINLESSIASDILTRQISKELGKLGLSAQIDFDDNFEDARVKIGGDIVGGARWSFGGNVNDISGSRLEIEIPLDDFINLTEEEWLNILLNFTYVNSPETIRTDENQIHWEGKLKLGGSW